MAMEVLGITVDNIFARLAERIGQERVDRIRSVMDRLTGIWEFVRDVMDRGAVAIRERIQQQLSNLWDIVVEGIRNWVVTRIVQRVTARLLSMLDPTGIMTVINGFITFFRAVQSFIEQLTRILQVINTFVQGVGEIARGNIQQAADFLENALSRALPVAIAFLANQVGLRGLGRRIGEMIGRAREAINRGIDWLINRAISMGSAILNRLLGRGSQVEDSEENELSGNAASLNGLNETFNDRTSDQHTLRFAGTTQPRIVVESETKELGQFINEKKNELADDDPQQESLNQALIKYNEISILLDEIVTLEPSAEAHNQKYEEIQLKYNEILALLPAVEIDDTVFPDMQLPPFSNSIAGSFEAEFIRKDTVNDAPSSSNAGQNDGSLEGWEELRISGLRQSESWVRMHLLTHRFKGSYLNSNLTPARTGLNNPTFLELEEDADSFVQNNQNEAIWYRVNISYQDVDVPSSISSVTQSGRTNARYLSSLHAAWGKYDKSNGLNKIRHTGASKDTLNVSNIIPPAFTGPAPSAKILNSEQFGVYKTQSNYNTNVALGSALGVTEATIREWLQNGVPNAREEALRTLDSAAMDTALGS